MYYSLTYLLAVSLNISRHSTVSLKEALCLSRQYFSTFIFKCWDFICKNTISVQHFYLIFILLTIEKCFIYKLYINDWIFKFKLAALFASYCYILHVHYICNMIIEGFSIMTRPNNSFFKTF